MTLLASLAFCRKIKTELFTSQDVETHYDQTGTCLSASSWSYLDEHNGFNSPHVDQAVCHDWILNVKCLEHSWIFMVIDSPENQEKKENIEFIFSIIHFFFCALTDKLILSTNQRREVLAQNQQAETF